MSLWLAAGLILVSVVVMAGVMTLVRRRAPAGGQFRGADQAGSVYNFIGTGFAILLGFVVLISFDGYSNAKTQSTAEATAVFEQYQVAETIRPEARRNLLWGGLVCYGRSVKEAEWPAMKNGQMSPLVSMWIEHLELMIADVSVADLATNATAYTQWFEQASKRDEARRERLLEAEGGIPSLLWLMLTVAAACAVGFVLLYADPTERLVGQIALIVAPTAIVVASFLAVVLLSSPFLNGEGSVKPTAMSYTLELIAAEEALIKTPVTLPCDAKGNPNGP